MALQGILVVVLTLAQEPPGRALVSPDPPREHSLQTHDLHYAAHRGDLEAVRAAVIAGADVNEVRNLMGIEGEAPQTPLFIAAERGHASIVQYLLAAGADPDIRCSEKGTALTIAAARGRVEILRALLAAGADVLRPRPKDVPALGWAAHRGDPESFVLLLEASRAAGMSAEEEATIFQDLRHSRERRLLERLLTWKPESVPALHSAARSREVAEVERLLASGAAASEADDEGWTALHWAAFSESVEAMRLLLAAGANPNARTSGGCTPLMLAARYTDPELALLLLEAGADPNAVDEEHGTALHVAAWSGGPELIWLLLDRGARNVGSSSGQTPRMVAEARRSFLGVDVHWAFDGRTRPAWATEPGEVKLVTDPPAPRIRVNRAEVVRIPKNDLAFTDIYLEIEPFPIDLAFDVYCRQGEETFPVRQLFFPAYTVLEGPNQYQIITPAKGLGSEIELILIPSPMVAMCELSSPPSAIWGQEVRVRCELVEKRGD